MTSRQKAALICLLVVPLACFGHEGDEAKSISAHSEGDENGGEGHSTSHFMPEFRGCPDGKLASISCNTTSDCLLEGHVCMGGSCCKRPPSPCSNVHMEGELCSLKNKQPCAKGFVCKTYTTSNTEGRCCHMCADGSVGRTCSNDKHEIEKNNFIGCGRDYSCETIENRTIGQCCPNPRHGHCPEPGPCKNSCDDDSTCGNYRKCCDNGCGGNSCMKARYEPIDDKDPETPCVHASLEGTSCHIHQKHACEHGYECRLYKTSKSKGMCCRLCPDGSIGRRHCSSSDHCGGGYTCETGETGTNGQCCPKPDQGKCPPKPSTCQTSCNNNKDCSALKMCCKNGCGGHSCVHAIFRSNDFTEK